VFVRKRQPPPHRASASSLVKRYAKYTSDSSLLALVKGELALESDEVERAQKRFAKVLSVDHENVEALCLMGRLHFEAGRHTEAVDCFRRLVLFSVCARACMYVCVYVYARVYVHICVCTCVRVYVCTCVRVYVYIYIYMCVRVYMHVCMYMCVYVCTCESVGVRSVCVNARLCMGG
jgi:hypothetical protein